jgi:hypothetical protein
LNRRLFDMVGRKQSAVIKWVIRLSIIIVALCSVIFILVGVIIQGGDRGLKTLLSISLIEIGITLFIASSIGVISTELYKKLRELTITDELYDFVTRLKFLLHKKEEITRITNVINLEKSGAINYYVNRKGEAEDDMITSIEESFRVNEETNILIIGRSLRVFFSPDAPYTSLIRRLLSSNPYVYLKVLLVNANSEVALLRASTECYAFPFRDFSEYQGCPVFKDCLRTLDTIDTWNSLYKPIRNNRKAIEAKLYDTSDPCFSVVFPTFCYIEQYLLGTIEDETENVGLPVLKYKKGSYVYSRVLRHYNWVWDNAVLPDDFYLSLNTNPVL